MKVKLITPDKNIFEGEAISVKLPGAKGSFEVLENHAAIISILDTGELRIRTNEQQDLLYQVDSGLVEVAHNQVMVLVETVEKK